MVDIHTHLIPGVDDGARNMQETVEMARLAHEDGITTIVATPHGVWNGEVNGGVMVRGGVGDVTRALERAGLTTLTVVPGAEVRMDRDLPAQLQLDPAWTVGGAGNYLLLEPPWGPLPEYHLTLVQELVASGVIPIIAHPERSPGVQANPAVVDRWIAAGALTQVTGNSLLGKHGSQAKGVADHLLETGRVHVIASDAHNATNRAPLLSKARELVADRLGEEEAEALFVLNPQRIVDGLEVPHTIPPAENSGYSSGAPRRPSLGGLFRRRRQP